MAGDGVSLPTTIAQMGNVAKSQARGQQAAQPTAPFAEQLDKNEDLKVQRVKETNEAEKRRIDPDEERKDKRKRRRLRRNRKRFDREAAGEHEAEQQEQDGASNPEEAEEAETVEPGTLIDMRV